jgi:hypothetical protein
MTDRRTFLGATSLAMAAALPSLTQAQDSRNTAAASPDGYRIPKLELLYECDASLQPAQEFGKTVEGQRRIIPITGGTFRGPKVRGEVVSGGWDWNLSRSDGASTIEAAYYLKTDDGTLIRVVNVGVSSGEPPAMDAATGESFFMFTHPSFEAPVGKYDWLNRTTCVATLGARKNAKNAVLIRVFRLV